jgi:hypothetical protein
MAWFYRYYAKELSPEDAKAYERAKIAAKEEHAGLWRDPAPKPPWLFRRGERDAEVKAQGGRPTTPATGPIIGNRASKIYQLLGWLYAKVASVCVFILKSKTRTPK